MSIVAENLDPKVRPKDERRRVGRYKPQLGTRVKWALEDSMERSIEAQKRMKNVLAWLEETHRCDIDDRGRAHLGKLQLELFALALAVSEIERIVTTTMAECKPARKQP